MTEQSELPDGYVDQATYDAACLTCREFADANSDLQRDDLILALIELCLGGGVDKERSIITAINTTGRFSTKHIAFMLSAGASPDPSCARWRKIGPKTYALH